MSMCGARQIHAKMSASISELLIDTPDGGQVALKDVAKVSLKPSPNIIQPRKFPASHRCRRQCERA